MKLLREVNLVQIQRKRLKIFVLFLPSSVKPISLCLCHHLSVEQLMGVVRVWSYIPTSKLVMPSSEVFPPINCLF